MFNRLKSPQGRQPPSFFLTIWRGEDQGELDLHIILEAVKPSEEATSGNWARRAWMHFGVVRRLALSGADVESGGSWKDDGRGGWRIGAENSLV